MNDTPELAVLRLGHRPGRDERMTTHVGLTARALGGDRVILANEAAGRGDSIREITDHFGGPFEVQTTMEPMALLENWSGTIVHLTMYGLSLLDVESDVRETYNNGSKLLVVVGAEKIPFEVYEAADWNIGVTNQPHSEVASLAVFLDRLFEGAELDRDWQGAERAVVPQAEGKRVEDVGAKNREETDSSK